MSKPLFFDLGARPHLKTLHEQYLTGKLSLCLKWVEGCTEDRPCDECRSQKARVLQESPFTRPR